MILGLKGYAEAGKDSLADVLVEEFGFVRFGFADALRAAMAALNPIVDVGKCYRYNDALDELGYVEAKKQYDEIRELLQRLGTEVGRNILGEDVWVDAAMKTIESATDYVATDLRFPNEYFAVREAGGITIEVKRPGYGPVNDHPSETAIDHLAFDYTVYNDGSLDDLAEQARELFSVLDGAVDDSWQTPFEDYEDDFMVGPGLTEEENE